MRARSLARWWWASTVPDRARAPAHDQRLRRRAGGVEAHAAHEVAVGHAGGREEAVLARDEILGREHALEVVARVARVLRLVVVARPQASEHRAADAADGGGREHALGRAADAPQQVDARVGHGREQRARDVAVGDQADARAGVADARDHLGVARPVEHDHHEVAERRRRGASRRACSTSSIGSVSESRPCRSGPPTSFSM